MPLSGPSSHYRCAFSASFCLAHMRSGLFVPIFYGSPTQRWWPVSPPKLREAGWHGVFVWDHLQFRSVRDVADPLITLAAIATATNRIRLGPMVTPLALTDR